MNLKGKNVVITGGAGFIGSHLAQHFLNEGSKVLVMDNLSVGKKEFIPDGALFKKVDIRSKDLKSIMDVFEPDIVVHLAAIHYIPYCNANPEETFDVNVMGTRNLLKALNNDIKFFFASSGAVYPPIEKPCTEDLEGPIDIYGKTKIIGEDLVKLYCKNPIIGRIFNVYGPRDLNPHLIPDIMEQLQKGEHKIKLGNLTPKRDFIHVEDVCRAIITLLEQNKSGTFNIGSGKAYSVKEVVDLISKSLDEKIEIIQENHRIRDIEREVLLSDITKIHKETGWKPKIKLEEGLKSTRYLT